MPIRDLIKFEGEPVVDSTFLGKEVVRFDGDESNPVLTIPPIINYSLSCIILQAHYIGDIKEGNGYGFEISNTLSNRTQIMSGMIVPTVHGISFATDCGHLAVHGDTLIQAFAFVDNSIIWGNPILATIPDFTQPIPLRVRFDVPIYTDLTETSVVFNFIVTGGRQPLIRIYIVGFLNGSSFVRKEIPQSDLNADGEGSEVLTGNFANKTMIFTITAVDSDRVIKSDSVTIVFPTVETIALTRTDANGILSYTGNENATISVQITGDTNIYRASKNVDWGTLTTSGNVITFSPGLNEDDFNRVAQIDSVLLDDDDNQLAKSNIITITQEARPSLEPTITINPRTKRIGWNVLTPQTYEVTITNGTAENISIDSTSSWAEASLNNDATILTLTPNSVNSNDSDRRAVAILTITTAFGEDEAVAELFQNPQPDLTPTISVSPSSILVPNDDLNTRTFTITLTNQGAIKPTISGVADWVRASLNGNVLTVNARSINTSTSQRNNVITFSITTGFGSDSTTATFSQRRSTVVPPTPPTITITNTPQNIAYNITRASFDFTLTNSVSNNVSIVPSSLPSWISTSQISGNQLLLTFGVNNNKSNSRTARIRLSVSTNDGNNNDTAVLVQANDPRPDINILPPTRVITATTTTGQDYTIVLTNAAYSNIQSITGVPGWITLTRPSSSNSGVMTLKPTANTGRNSRTANVLVNVRTSEGSVSGLAVLTQGGVVVTDTLIRLDYNVPGNGELQLSSHLSTTFKFEIIVIGSPLTTPVIDTTLSLGAITGESFIEADSSKTDNRTTHFIVGTISENPFGRQRNIPFSFYITNLAGTSNELNFVLKQGAKPPDPPSFDIIPKTSNFNWNESPDAITIINLANAKFESGNDDFTIPSKPSWISFTKDYQSSGISFTATNNTGSNPRSGSITIRATANGQSFDRVYRVTQGVNLVVTILVAPDFFSVAYDETETKTSTILLNNASPSEIVIENSASWLSVSRSNLDVFLTPEENTLRNQQSRGTDVIVSVTKNGVKTQAVISFSQRGKPCIKPSINSITPNTITVGYLSGSSQFAMVDFDDGNCFVDAVFTYESGTRNIFDFERDDRAIKVTALQTNEEFESRTARYSLQYRNRLRASLISNKFSFSLVQSGKPKPTVSINPTSLELGNSVITGISKSVQITVTNAPQRNVVVNQDPSGIFTFDWVTTSLNSDKTTLTVTANSGNNTGNPRVARYFICITEAICIGLSVTQFPMEQLGVTPMIWSPSNERQSQEFTITGTTGVPTITESPDRGWLWLSTVRNNKFTANVTENILDAIRTTKIIITDGTGPSQRSVEIPVKQDKPFRLEATASPSVLRKTVSPAETSVTLGFTITSNDLASVGVSEIDRAVTLSGPDSTGAVSVLINIGQVDFTQGFKTILIDVVEITSRRRLDQVDIILTLAGAPP